MIGTMAALTQALQQAVGQGAPQGPQAPPTTSNAPYTKTSYEILSKRTETFDSEKFVDWKFKFRNNCVALLGKGFVDGLDEFGAALNQLCWQIFQTE